MWPTLAAKLLAEAYADVELSQVSHSTVHHRDTQLNMSVTLDAAYVVRTQIDKCKHQRQNCEGAMKAMSSNNKARLLTAPVAALCFFYLSHSTAASSFMSLSSWRRSQIRGASSLTVC